MTGLIKRKRMSACRAGFGQWEALVRFVFTFAPSDYVRLTDYVRYDALGVADCKRCYLPSLTILKLSEKCLV